MSMVLCSEVPDTDGEESDRNIKEQCWWDFLNVCTKNSKCKKKIINFVVLIFVFLICCEF